MDNPFSISFGKKPLQYISRYSSTNDIIETFESENPSTQAYMLVGVRGAGKTVMLSMIASELSEEEDWIVLELNPTRSLLESLAAKLYAIPKMSKAFIESKIDLSLLGIGLSMEKGNKIFDIEQAIDTMLVIVKKKKKKVLIVLDEVTNNQFVKEFASAFQIYIRKDYPLFLLMTGLYENVYSLQNDKSLTFLYRTPKVMLDALNITSILVTYQKVFGISPEEARRMAQLTKGYPFAFQVLGYLFWKEKDNLSKDGFVKTYEKIMPVFDHMLQEYVYEKVWNELSLIERNIICYVAKNENVRIKDIRENLKMDSDKFTVYRSRLIKKGIIKSEGYGTISICLPRFEEYIREIYTE